MTHSLFNAVLENKYFQLLNLLQNGENPNIFDEDGFTPLMRWFQYNDNINNTEQMLFPDTLLLYGSNINERSYDDNGTTVLMEEAIKNNLYTVNYLLDKGADLTVKCISLRETAYEKAEKLGNVCIENCLLDKCTARSSSFTTVVLDNYSTPTTITEKKYSDTITTHTTIVPSKKSYFLHLCSCITK
jgi:ankyrin repeat protein